MESGGPSSHLQLECPFSTEPRGCFISGSTWATVLRAALRPQAAPPPVPTAPSNLRAPSGGLWPQPASLVCVFSGPGSRQSADKLRAVSRCWGRRACARQEKHMGSPGQAPQTAHAPFWRDRSPHLCASPQQGTGQLEDELPEAPGPAAQRPLGAHRNADTQAHQALPNQGPPAPRPR